MGITARLRKPCRKCEKYYLPATKGQRLCYNCYVEQNRLKNVNYRKGQDVNKFEQLCKEARAKGIDPCSIL